MMEQIALPQEFIEQLRPLLGSTLPDFLHSYQQPPARGLRARPGTPPPEEARERVPWAENAWYLPLSSAAGSHPLHEAGAYYLQEPSAMAAAAALAPRPGERVLDLCAAPGGKSTQMAALMQGRGTLVCNEPVAARAQVLSRNIERMGVKNAVVVSALPEELSPRWPEYFDRVLVDAPCSGEGMFRRHPEAIGEWSPAAPAGCAQRQAAILLSAARMLRPGGRLAYSTCTFSAEENEGVIQAFLRERAEFALVPFSLPGLPPCDGMLRLWPHQTRGDGHFVALLEKQGAPRAEKPRRRGEKPPLPAPDAAAAALARDFLKEYMAGEAAPNALFAGRLTQAPEQLPPLEGVRTLRVGLQLGEARGKLFVPDHALALAVPCQRAWPLEEAAARLYQAGQPLPVPDGLRGWLTPTLDGLSLGWAKASDGLLKNHYPKGLRK